MKRENNLFEKVITFDNLHHSFYQVLKGKRDKIAANSIFLNLEKELFSLQYELENDSYKPGEYNTFWITEPKARMISAAPIRDRIVHHAIMNILEPVLEKKFIYHSYACRKGRGNHKALKQFVVWSRKSKFVLKMDIKKFFPTINHEIMKDVISSIIKDKRLIKLINLIIDNSNEQEPVTEYFEGDSLFTPYEKRKGLPIGNLTSQWFGNLYLNQMDHFIKEKLKMKMYLRYVDDFACFSDSKEELRDIRKEIVSFLENYRLKLNKGKSRTRQLKEGVEFLGFVILPTTMRVNAKNLKRMRIRLKKQHSSFFEGRVVEQFYKGPAHKHCPYDGM